MRILSAVGLVLEGPKSTKYCIYQQKMRSPFFEKVAFFIDFGLHFEVVLGGFWHHLGSIVPSVFCMRFWMSFWSCGAVTVVARWRPGVGQWSIAQEVLDEFWDPFNTPCIME